MAKLDNSSIAIMSSGLKYPEGPIHCSDGSIMLVEIMGRCLSIVPAAGGAARKIVDLPGGPNGAAVGADGKIYICNNGGFEWIPIPDRLKPIIWVAGNQPPKPEYLGGKLQKIDTRNGQVTDLFTECCEREMPPGFPKLPWDPPFALTGLDDLIVDELGGIWFTDYGKTRGRERDITGVYYVSPDGKTIKQMIYPLNSPNGIALSPDGKRLYVALTFERKILYYDIPEPGVIKWNTVTGVNKGTLDGSYLLTADLIGQSVLDSMAIDVEGNVYVATMLPVGNNPYSNGGISIVSPEGKVEFVEINLGDEHPVPLPSNICFGGEDMKTAYITCGGSGHLIKMPSSIPGLKLNHNGSNFDVKNIRSPEVLI